MALRASCAQAGVASRARARSRSVSSQCSNPVAVSALGARCVALGAVVASGTLVAGWAIDARSRIHVLVRLALPGGATVQRAGAGAVAACGDVAFAWASRAGARGGCVTSFHSYVEVRLAR